jgi:N utilization substance protein A
VPDDQLSLAIGRRGQNVRLASQLTGWSIDIMTEAQESERRQEEIRSRTQAFIEKLDVDDVIAHLLVAEGFVSVEEIAFAELDELTEIEGFDEEIGEELQRRAQDFVLAEQERLTQKVTELQIAEDLLDVEGLTLAMLVRLGEAQVTTLDDLADLSSDELRYIVNPATPTATVDDIAGLEEVAQRLGADSSPVSGPDADAIIMAARAHWFDDDAADGDAASADEPEQAAE